MNKCLVGVALLCFVTHMQGMNKGMSHNDFTTFFLDSRAQSDKSLKFSTRSVDGNLGRFTSPMYPLECALSIIGNGLKNKEGLYTDDQLVERVDALLKAGAPTSYKDFNPLVYILYKYDNVPSISNYLCQRLIQLLLKYGANPDDVTKDTNLIKDANLLDEKMRVHYPMSSLEKAVFGDSPSFNKILSSIESSHKLTSDNINQLKTLVQNHQHQISHHPSFSSLRQPDGGNPNVTTAHVPAQLGAGAANTGASLMPRSLPYAQVGIVVIGSFVAGVICTRLYDWYIDQPDADNAKDLEKS